MVLTTSDFADFAKVHLNDLRHFVVILIAGLTVSEECFGVLCCTTGNRALWRQCTVAETLDVCFVYKRTDVVFLHEFNLVVLVRCAESVKEVYERNACLK